jgi:hypothetical protein
MVDTVNLEFLMRRRAPIFSPALLVSILGGCARLDAAPPLAAAQSQDGLYECRLISQGVATPGPDVRLMLRPVSQNGQLPLKIEPDDWQSLDAAVGSNGRIFANPNLCVALRSVWRRIDRHPQHRDLSLHRHGRQPGPGKMNGTAQPFTPPPATPGSAAAAAGSTHTPSALRRADRMGDRSCRGTGHRERRLQRPLAGGLEIARGDAGHPPSRAG